MYITDQLSKAQTFLEMHHREKLLLIPNIWNGGSTKLFEKPGFEALATTSAGIACSMGSVDGKQI